MNSSLSLISKVEFVIDNLWWTLFLVCDVMKREPHIAVLLLLSSSSLSSPHRRPVRLTEEVLRQGIATLFGMLADWEEGRLMSQNNYIIGVWVPFFFVVEKRRKGGEEVKSKGHSSYKTGGYLLMSSFLQTIHRCWESESLPVSWKKPTLVWHSGRGAGFPDKNNE